VMELADFIRIEELIHWKMRLLSETKTRSVNSMYSKR